VPCITAVSLAESEARAWCFIHMYDVMNMDLFIWEWWELWAIWDVTHWIDVFRATSEVRPATALHSYGR